MSRASLVLDAEHRYSETKMDDVVALKELQRLCSSAKDEGRVKSLREEIDNLQDKKRRPWSARPSGGMKTIPESQQRSNEDELDRHEVNAIWATASTDPRQRAALLVDRFDGSNFWISSGLYPHLLGFHFRRTVLLSKVVVYCTDVRTLRLHWRQTASKDWTVATVPPKTIHAQLTEFIFHLQGETPTLADALKVEILEGEADFAIVRHLRIVEADPASPPHILQ